MPSLLAAAMFRLYPLRLEFRAVDSVYFPSGKAANVIRGAFGSKFKSLACQPGCRDSRSCPDSARCLYARIFEPVAQRVGGGGGPPQDVARPFVFRASHLDGQMIPRGGAFHFDLNIFELRYPAIACFVLTFAEMARAGFGPQSGRAALLNVSLLHPTPVPVYERNALVAEAAWEPISLSLDVAPRRLAGVRIHFVTPTEIQARNLLLDQPEFGPLFARIRDRVSALAELYGSAPIEADFRGLGQRAQAARMTRCEIAHVDVRRVSGRSGQSHPLGGFTGFADYVGEDLAEFLPWLEIARYTGVGRQTVWGKGVIQAEPNHVT